MQSNLVVTEAMFKRLGSTCDIFELVFKSDIHCNFNTGCVKDFTIFDVTEEDWIKIAEAALRGINIIREGKQDVSLP